MSYFDYAATQPMRQSAIDAWVNAAGMLNAGAQYASGRKARSVLDDARETVAELLGCEPIEVVFTASGTEADNIAVQGLFHSSVNEAGAGRISSTPIEHSAVRDTVHALKNHTVPPWTSCRWPAMGTSVTYLRWTHPRQLPRRCGQIMRLARLCLSQISLLARRQQVLQFTWMLSKWLASCQWTFMNSVPQH